MAKKNKHIKAKKPAPAPAKPKKKAKIGRPKKRGRKRKYKPRKQTTIKRSRKRALSTNSGYYKVYNYLKNYVAEQAKIDPRYEVIQKTRLREYTSVLYAEFKRSSEAEGKKKVDVSTATLDEFFKPENDRLQEFLKRIGVIQPLERFLFWRLDDILVNFPPDTYIDINHGFIDDAGISGRQEDVFPQVYELINDVNAYIRAFPEKFEMGKYLWYEHEILPTGHQFNLIYDQGLASQIAGKPLDIIEEIGEELPAEEITEPTPAPVISDDEKRKQKAEADKAEAEASEAKFKSTKAEIEAIGAAIKDLYGEAKMQIELGLDPADTLAEIKRLTEKRKKLL